MSRWPPRLATHKRSPLLRLAAVVAVWGALAAAEVSFAVDRTTTTTPSIAGQSWYVFPSVPSASQFRLPSPALPLVIQGRFRASSAGAGKVTVLCSCLSPDLVGLVVLLDKQDRLQLRVSHGDASSGDASSTSQQVNLRSGHSHSFTALITETRIQVLVDGLLGTSAKRRAVGACEDGATVCVFSQQWRDRATPIVGGVTASPGDDGVWLGSIESLAVRRLSNGEEPKETAADGAQEGVADKPRIEGASDGGQDILLLVLIPVLLLILACLIIGGGMVWHFYLRSRPEPTYGTTTARVAPSTAGAAASSKLVTPAPAPAIALTVAAAPAASQPAPSAVGAGADVASSASTPGPEPEPAFPEWWTARPAPGVSELVPVSSATRQAVQELMNSTWRGVVTRDRRVDAGARKKVTKFEVVQVNRNENVRLWEDYIKKRASIGSKLTEDDLLNCVLTANARTELGATKLQNNEFLLWHGTKPSACASICQQDFLLKLCGSHRGTLYGHGLYFAESVSKADEYADDDKEGVYKGLYAMLLCRVTLGKSLYTDEPRPDGKRLRELCTAPGAEYDSVLGDREKIHGTYREFIVYAVQQAYPEYVVIYRREDNTE